MVRVCVPAISATNKANPIPTGAKKVPLLFSAASINTVTINKQVKNISIKSPCATLVPGLNVVFTSEIGPGNMTDTMAAEEMAPRICAGNRMRPRIGGRAEERTRPRVTCGVC